jgi:hypothetical protein
MRFEVSRHKEGSSFFHVVVVMTDSLIEALFEKNLRQADDDGTSWNATTYGPWVVYDKATGTVIS